MSINVSIEELARRMKGGRTVAFTGAGMSTESGLSDFRSANGIWSRLDPMEIATTQAMMSNYDQFHEFYSLRFAQMKNAQPNIGHKLIAKWESQGLVESVITQNVDGLHAAAGSVVVHELHGSVNKVRCCNCGAPATQEGFIAKKPCSACGGPLRPGVVLFGEGLPEDTLNAAWVAAENADVMIVLGSSLQVSPANQLPRIAKRANAVVAICNRDATPLDSIADLRSFEGIGEFLTRLDEALAREG